ncbi:Uncharacterized protein dnm_086260 [Desulfonema magnum]|uniref:Uncharacterized protein n=1 Tax=Desulfonema magnum TaxID=45655 RepID=A0A975BVS5_9BACT|nr:Uncharacterized protein dnm_086260 [Desulfonema magnum]
MLSPFFRSGLTTARKVTDGELSLSGGSWNSQIMSQSLSDSLTIRHITANTTLRSGAGEYWKNIGTEPG